MFCIIALFTVLQISDAQGLFGDERNKGMEERGRKAGGQSPCLHYFQTTTSSARLSDTELCVTAPYRHAHIRQPVLMALCHSSCLHRFSSGLHELSPCMTVLFTICNQRCQSLGINRVGAEFSRPGFKF